METASSGTALLFSDELRLEWLGKSICAEVLLLSLVEAFGIIRLEDASWRKVECKPSSELLGKVEAGVVTFQMMVVLCLTSAMNKFYRIVQLLRSLPFSTVIDCSSGH